MKRAPSITSAEMRAEVMKAEVEQVGNKKKNTIVSFILKTLSQMDRLKIFMFSGTTEARHG